MSSFYNHFILVGLKIISDNHMITILCVLELCDAMSVILSHPSQAPMQLSHVGNFLTGYTYINKLDKLDVQAFLDSKL